MQTVATRSLGPIVRWAGGKRWLSPLLNPTIAALAPARLLEPFLGGAAIFLNSPGSIPGLLSDANPDLINMYRAVKANPKEIASRLANMENNEAVYYGVRSSYVSRAHTDATSRAVEFLYLNHHSYNGIHRVNMRGEYNVPFGHRTRAQVPDSLHLERVALRLARTSLEVRGFEGTMDAAGPDDLLYCDPPYTVAHNDNGFIKYNQHLFTFDDQIALAASAAKAAERGASVIVSNANHASVRALYPTFHQYELPRKSTIGGRNASRAHTTELIASNRRIETLNAYLR